jgi:Rrf2 family protein
MGRVVIPLSRASQYAIRALTYMAAQPDDGFVHTRDMAESLDVPAHSLAKVLQPLSALGILHSQRGRSGGLRLARNPEGISLREVAGALEPMDGSMPCALGQRRCDDDVPCPLHEDWTRVWTRHVETLQSTTVADLARFSHEHPGGGYPYPAPAPPPSNGHGKGNGGAPHSPSS